MCLLICLVRLHFPKKTLPQWVHLCGFLPVCVIIRIIRLLFLESLIALVALIWFLPSVCPHMYYYITLSMESFNTLASLIWLLPSVYPRMFYMNILSWESFITMIALIWFLQCVFSDGLLRLLLIDKALSQWLHWCGFSLVCVFICITSLLWYKKSYHIGCIAMVSPQCVSSGGFSDHYSVRRPCHNRCIDMVFLQYVF